MTRLIDGICNFDFIDVTQFIFCVIVSLSIVIVIIRSKPKYYIHTKLALFGLLFIFVALSFKMFCQMFNLEMTACIGGEVVDIQYALTTMLYIIGIAMAIFGGLCVFILNKRKT